jgi:hypothetical protein
MDEKPQTKPCDLQTLRRIVSDYARRINASDVSVFGTPQGDGSPYIEVANDAYYFVIEERGIELDRRRTADLDELLYWIFDGVTFSISSDFELRHRKSDEDSRRQLFCKHESLLAQLSPHWGERKVEEHRPAY